MEHIPTKGEYSAVNIWEKASLTFPSPISGDVEKLILANSSRMNVPAKKVFHVPGDALNGVYYIVDGRTRHYMVAMDGTEKTLYTLTAGWFFGETPCSLHEPTGLYSMAEQDTTIAVIPPEVYNRLMDESKAFRDAILTSYSRKMQILRHEVENLTFNSCKDRLKRLICSVADTSTLVDGKWYNLKVHYTQYEISTIVGGARVTVTKLLNELCAEGFLRIVNRRIQVSQASYLQVARWLEEHRY